MKDNVVEDFDDRIVTHIFNSGANVCMKPHLRSTYESWDALDQKT